jgi:hypothetical protein
MQGRLLLLSITGIIILHSLGSANAQTAPPPLRNVTIQARVTLDDEGRYNYFYTVTNPSTNALGISQVAIDITTPPDGMQLSEIGSLLPGHKKPYLFQLEIAKEGGFRVIPFSILSVPGWDEYGLTFGVTLLNSDAAADWSRWRESVPPLPPGQSLGEFQLTSYGLPGIRDIVAKPRIGDLDLPPDWTDTEDDTDEEIEEKWRKQESLGCLVKTIGATAPPAAFTPVQFNQRILEYISESVTLQWLKDPNLTQQLRALLVQNDLALREERYADAQPLLLPLMQLVQGGTTAQRTSEAEGLLYYNAQYLYERLIGGFPVVFEIAPLTAEHPINEIHEVQVRVTEGINPKPNHILHAIVISGPHEGLSWRGFSDSQGRWSFRYRGEKVGRDQIVLLCTHTRTNDDDYCIDNSVPIYVTWEGGPDLQLEDLFPPVIQIPYGRTAIPLSGSTVNIGTVRAPPSKTRYYLSKNQYRDSSALVLGEHNVPVLNVNEVSAYQANIPPPQNLEPGLYWLFGCADADKEIAELNEENNCRTRILQMFAVAGQARNSPLDCSQAKASPKFLWPPDHKYRRISIAGVRDQSSNPMVITATSIRQNEPVNGLGRGDMSPDGSLNPLQVRAERAANGNGRIYAIGFTVKDAKGGTCQGTVTVCVPHDLKEGAECAGSETLYDSTLQ